MVRVYPPASDPDDTEAIADLIAREANQVLEAAARVTEPATVLGHLVRIVPRGALAAMRFRAAISTRRAIEDRYQDVADIGRIVAKRAESDLAALLDDLRHSRPVKI